MPANSRWDLIQRLKGLRVNLSLRSSSPRRDTERTVVQSDTLYASELEGWELSASHLRRFPFRRKSKVTNVIRDWRSCNMPCLCQGRNSELRVWVVYTISTSASIGSRWARISNCRSFTLTNVLVSSVLETTYLRASFSWINYHLCTKCGVDSSVGIATRYGFKGVGIETYWGARF